MERIRRGEELSVVLHEEGTVVLDLEAPPGVTDVLSFFSLLSSLLRAATGATCLRSALSTFFFTLTVSFLIYKLFTAGKVSLNFFVGRLVTLHPGMSTNIINGGALLWIKRHHLLEEVLELV